MLEGKVALITGASQGLGRALAVAYVKEGARVVINARSEERIGRMMTLIVASREYQFA